MREGRVRPTNGKLGVMCIGLGAVTTTTIIGALMARKGLSKPTGSFVYYKVYGEKYAVKHIFSYFS